MRIIFIDCIINLYSLYYKLVKRMAVIYEHGQVVIPKYIREMFKLTPGTRVSFVPQNGELVLKSEYDVLKEFEELTSMADSTFAETEHRIKEVENRRKKAILHVH